MKAITTTMSMPRLLLVAALLALAGGTRAAVPSTERQALINVYNATSGGGWSNHGNWCSSQCPATGVPVFAAAGTECSWYGVACDSTLAHVVALALPANNLVGTLPSLGALTSLRYVNVSANHLSGSLPSLGGLAELQSFYAPSNAFSGSIPALSGLTKLGDFSVQDNQLTGAIPSLGGLTALFRFVASGNQLSGSVPSLTGLSALREFDVGENRLTGAIPAVSGLTNLSRFAVDHNALTGSIPALPPGLISLQLGHNALSGAIPAAPASLYTPLALAPSTLCPNPLNIGASPNDGGWNLATGTTTWWATPTASNRCDDLFRGRFD